MSIFFNPYSVASEDEAIEADNLTALLDLLQSRPSEGLIEFMPGLLHRMISFAAEKTRYRQSVTLEEALQPAQIGDDIYDRAFRLISIDLQPKNN